MVDRANIQRGKGVKNMSEDRCVCCGEIVPEGRMVCQQCINMVKETPRFYGLYTPLTFEPSLTKDACPMCKRPFNKDFVEVVRCKNCEWWTKQKDSLQGKCILYGTYPTGNWYCANGKRKEETDGTIC